MPNPLYTADNCQFACPLQWGVSAFWREPMTDDQWLPALTSALDADGIRLLRHGFSGPQTSQFFVSTLPGVAPVTVVQRIKGRLQYLVRSARPQALKGNYAIRSIGNVTRELIEGYVASQVEHHRYADPRFAERLQAYQFVDDSLDLSRQRHTTHGVYWYNLHLVFVRKNRDAEWHDRELSATRDMILKASAARGYLLSRAGILPDHVHLVLGCPLENTPAEVALSFMNNLAFASGMRPIFQFGAFVGTVGEYDNRAIA